MSKSTQCFRSVVPLAMFSFFHTTQGDEEHDRDAGGFGWAPTQPSFPGSGLFHWNRWAGEPKSRGWECICLWWKKTRDLTFSPRSVHFEHGFSVPAPQETYLEKFCLWQKQRKITCQCHWDYAVLLTGPGIYRYVGISWIKSRNHQHVSAISQRTGDWTTGWETYGIGSIGMSYQGGMCTEVKSFTLKCLCFDRTNPKLRPLGTFLFGRVRSAQARSWHGDLRGGLG